MTYKNTASAAALLLFSGSSAFADITAADIWNSYEALAETFGAELSGDLKGSGHSAKVENGQIRMKLPQNAGTLKVSLPAQIFTSNSDGTVSVGVNEVDRYKFSFTGRNGFSASGEILVRYKDAVTIASGTPGDITFSFQIPESFAELREVNFPRTEGTELADFKFHATAAGDTGTLRIVTGSKVGISAQRSIDSLSYTTNFTDPAGSRQDTNAQMSALTTDFNATLPRNGMSIMNLNLALADGLKLGVQSDTAAGSSTTKATLPGTSDVMTQTMTYGSTQASVAAGYNGIAMSQKIDGIQFNMQMPAVLPLPVALAMDTLQTSLAAPVSQADTPQGFSLQFLLSGLTLDEGIWNLFDPAKTLPRDPATVAASFKGETTLLKNLLDFQKLKSMKPGEQPLELNSLTMTGIKLSAAGAELTGTGSFSFNNEDLKTFGGFPAPAGEASFQLTGANGLIDKLIQMGLVTDSDAMGARMMMGMFAVPGEGADSLTSKIEITEGGQILANGQRIK